MKLCFSQFWDPNLCFLYGHKIIKTVVIDINIRDRRGLKSFLINSLHDLYIWGLWKGSLVHGRSSYFDPLNDEFQALIREFFQLSLRIPNSSSPYFLKKIFPAIPILFISPSIRLPFYNLKISFKVIFQTVSLALSNANLRAAVSSSTLLLISNKSFNLRLMSDNSTFLSLNYAVRLPISFWNLLSPSFSRDSKTSLSTKTFFISFVKSIFYP